MRLLYLDASALVKCYVSERFSNLVREAVTETKIVGTTILSRAEVSAALGKAVRVGSLKHKDAQASLQAFRNDWQSFVRVQASEIVAFRADALAWARALRGYDAIHLASALIWQESIGERINFATFDGNLWKAAKEEELPVFPENLPALLKK